MRFGLVAIAASLVAHVAIMELIDQVDPPPPRQRPTATRVAIVSRSPEPIDPIAIDLVLEPVAPAPAPGPAPASAAAAAPRHAGSRTSGTVETPATGGLAAATGPGGTVEPTAPGGTGILTMRRPSLKGVTLTLPEGFDVGGEPPPPPLVPSGELVPSGNGTFKSELGGFTAEVARNGDVSFKDRPAFSIHLTLPSPRAAARSAARGLENWFDDPSAPIRAAARDPGRAENREDLAVPGNPVRSDFVPPPMVTIPVLGGAADITDWAIRKSGSDPYASAKREYLDRTREERLAMRIERERELLSRSVATIRKHVDRVWKRAELPAADRRAAIFELWDECVEDGDEVAVDAGNQARAAVVGFVRARLPAGSPDAYTADELAALNRRRTSKAPFAPYE